MNAALQHTALILGGTSGLGNACARAIAAAGSRVVITGRDPGRCDQSAAALGDGHRGLAFDLSDPAATAAVLGEVRDLGVDQLVLNSGGPPPSKASETSIEALRAGLESLLLSQVQIVSALLPAMMATGWGRIVAIGSSGVRAPIPALTVSNVGRAALAAYLKSLAHDVAANGVTVNVVLPGRIATDRVNQLDQATAQRTGTTLSDVIAASVRRIPAGRYGDPDEFGAAVAFLASDAASFITGEQLRVDGGMSAAY